MLDVFLSLNVIKIYSIFISQMFDHNRNKRNIKMKLTYIMFWKTNWNLNKKWRWIKVNTCSKEYYPKDLLKKIMINNKMKLKKSKKSYLKENHLKDLLKYKQYGWSICCKSWHNAEMQISNNKWIFLIKFLTSNWKNYYYSC